MSRSETLTFFSSSSSCSISFSPADSLTHLAVLIHTGQAKPLHEHRADLPPGIAEVVTRAMATDRNLRFQSAQDLKAELAKFGAIAFRSTQAAMPPAQPVLPAPPMSAMGAPGLATSAAGVSVAQARSQVTQGEQKSQKNVIIAGSMNNEEAKQVFGTWDEPKPYIRIVPQPT